MTKTTDAVKRDYRALLLARAEGQTRPLRKAPLCLIPSAFDDLAAAREAFATAALADQQRTGRGATYKLSEKPALTVAQEALEAAEQAVRDVSIRIVLRGRDSDQILAINEKVEADATERGDEKPRQIDYHRALVADAFAWAEDFDGNRLDDITRDDVALVLSETTTGELGTLLAAVNMASQAPDFPTSRR